MIVETTYDPSDFTKGKCISCGYKSNQIVIGTKKCVDCIEADKFYDMTMNDYGEEDDE